MRIVTGKGRFTVACFVTIFENLTKSVAHGFPYLEILKGRLRHFYQATENGAHQSKTHFKEFWILI